jgi:hypothetical protein
MLKHQINNIMKQDQLQNASCIDLLVGGDRGCGKFRMTLKFFSAAQQFHGFSNR